MSFVRPLSRSSRTVLERPFTPANLPSDDEVESKQEGAQPVDKEDRALFRKYVNTLHSREVGGAVNSDDDADEKQETPRCMETADSEPDGADFPCENDYGTQVQRYVYPFYSPGHILNQHLFCPHVGPS
jgi:hypothetical protein